MKELKKGNKNGADHFTYSDDETAATRSVGQNLFTSFFLVVEPLDGHSIAKFSLFNIQKF